MERENETETDAGSLIDVPIDYRGPTAVDLCPTGLDLVPVPAQKVQKTADPSERFLRPIFSSLWATIRCGRDEIEGD
ncbi:hypothetical protein GWI33_003959 [Rhynchophorus ferrugineus]|uniref:Uncharacterized protein n=1 Tax=Rhynchophorus ferrugineus TaxID=354439 RepID=A0A834M082_RHYFE|nr:hypothetical protein GWI33_003959 [Rhynchophorus ferrugineus]